MSRFPEPLEPKRAVGFTLLELLVACAILTLVTLVLVSLTNHGSKLWATAESQSQYRQRARATMDFMAAELRQAVTPLDGSAGSLQLIINPPVSQDFLNRDAIFWQAPIATDSSAGDIAEIGYFVRWTGTRPNLRRLFCNPTSPDYLIHSAPNAWVTDSLLNTFAPPSTASEKADNYPGLFLENVLGLWVKAYAEDGSAFPSSAGNSGDSRVNNQLPAYVEISLALVSSSVAQRISAADVDAIRSAASYAADAKSFSASTTLPAYIRQNCGVISTVVSFANYR